MAGDQLLFQRSPGQGRAVITVLAGGRGGRAGGAVQEPPPVTGSGSLPLGHRLTGQQPPGAFCPQMAPLLPESDLGPAGQAAFSRGGVCMPLDHTKDLQRPDPHVGCQGLGRGQGQVAGSQQAPSRVSLHPRQGPQAQASILRGCFSSPWTSGLEPPTCPELRSPGPPAPTSHAPPRQMLSPPHQGWAGRGLHPGKLTWNRTACAPSSLW